MTGKLDMLLALLVFCGFHQEATTSADTCCKYDTTTATYSCRGCQLITVPDGIPTAVQTLDLSQNNLRVINDSAFVNYSQLVNLYLSNNQIQRLEPGSLKGLNGLQELDLRKNHLCVNDTTFNGIFNDTPNLKTLQMVNNECEETLTMYPNESLRILKELINVSLPFVKDADLGSAFSELTNLKYLMLMGTEPKEGALGCNVFNALANTSLEMLSLRNAGLHNICVSALQPLKELKYLNLACNKYLTMSNVVQVVNGLPEPTLKTIIADRAGAAELAIDLTSILFGAAWKNIEKFSLRFLFTTNIFMGNLSFLFNLPEMKYAGLAANMILYSAAPESKASIIRLFNQTKLETLDLGHFGAMSYSEAEFQQQYCLPDDIHTEPSIFFHEPPKDVFPPVTPQHNDFDPDVPFDEGQFLLRNIPLSLRYIYADFFSFGIIDLFQFKFNPLNQLLLLSISDSHFFGRFKSLENATNVQIIDGKNCGFSKFDRRPLQYTSLQKFILSGNNFQTIGSEKVSWSPFKFMTKLKILDFSDNKIHFIKSDVFNNLTLLEEIKLQNNDLSTLDFGLDGLTSIRLVNVSQNLITSVSETFMQSTDGTRSLKGKSLTLDITGNRLQCDCDKLSFVSWFQQTKVSITNRKDITCQYEGHEIKIHKISTKKMEFDCFTVRTHLKAIVFTMIPSIVVVIILGIIYRKRWKLQFNYYLLKDHFNKKGNRQRAMPSDDDTDPLWLQGRPVDVFISCADDDGDWLLEEVIPRLEEQWGYTSFWRNRDNVIGNSKTDVVAVLNSAAVRMCIISPNFCDDPFPCWELEMILAKGEESILFLYKKQIDSSNHAYFSRIIQHYNHLEYEETEEEKITCWSKLQNFIEQKPPIANEQMNA